MTSYRGTHIQKMGKNKYFARPGGQEYIGTLAEIKKKIDRIEWAGVPPAISRKKKYGNPGAAWHHNRYNSAFQRAYDPRITLGSQQIAGGMAEEAMQSEKESRRLGIPNPSKKSKLSKWLLPALAIGGLIWYLKSTKKI